LFHPEHGDGTESAFRRMALSGDIVTNLGNSGLGIGLLCFFCGGILGPRESSGLPSGSEGCNAGDEAEYRHQHLEHIRKSPIGQTVILTSLLISPFSSDLEVKRHEQKFSINKSPYQWIVRGRYPKLMTTSDQKASQRCFISSFSDLLRPVPFPFLKAC